MGKILVVDDDTTVRALMRTTLTMEGHDVVGAAGGEEALELIRIQEFDLVLLDVMMPVTDGYEVLERIKGMPSRAALPVVVVTAKPYDSDDVLREVSGGAIDHITKPFDPEDLLVVVTRAIGASRAQLEMKRGMMTRGATLYGAIERMRRLAEEPHPVGAGDRQPRRPFRR